MTSLITWAGVDSRGPASIYIASDSRISWIGGSKWDFGRKLFTSRNCPEILGYVGDVLFPSQVLGQIIEIIDKGIIFSIDETPESKFKVITSIIKRSFIEYPAEHGHPFTVIYCTRERHGMSSVFHAATLEWVPEEGWITEWLNIPSTSAIIKTFGSGRQSVEEWYSRWSRTSEGGTSRSVFNAFCDSLISGENISAGGAPQLVGLYRENMAESFGIIYNNTRYLFGVSIFEAENFNNIEWRNTLFERCDGITMKRIHGAQRHGRPRVLQKYD